MQPIDCNSLATLAAAARDAGRVKGLTHKFYRYPARFSPQFAATAIELFSKPGQMVLDPFMGGGTTLVEALVRDRMAVGVDLNELAVFVCRVKTMKLTKGQLEGVLRWVQATVPDMRLNAPSYSLAESNNDKRTRNLSLPAARPIKKAIAVALEALPNLRLKKQREFAKCILLSAAQWALNGRKSALTLGEFRSKVLAIGEEMAAGQRELTSILDSAQVRENAPVLIHDPASALPSHAPFASGARADLVVTSPPYPGVHILYHRWQVDGRKETPAPYWITDCNDGMGSSYYNFADRKGGGLNHYFDVALANFSAIRQVMREGGLIVQMVAFSEPGSMLPRYLEMMASAGFSEIVGGYDLGAEGRIWRSVPSRQWHASAKGNTSSSNEVVLVHRADG